MKPTPVLIRKMSFAAAVLSLIFGAAPFGGAQQQPTPVSTAAQVQSEILVQATASWDGTPYKAYPAGQPQITVRKVTIPPNTAMKWHTHPLPNAAYVLSGDLTVETEAGAKHHFSAGEVIAESVGVVHRGVTTASPAVLIVFYPGVPGLALSQ